VRTETYPAIYIGWGSRGLARSKTVLFKKGPSQGITFDQLAKTFTVHSEKSFCYVKPKFHLARHVSTRHVRRVEPCCSTSSTQPKCMRSTSRTCRVGTCEPSGIWALPRLRLWLTIFLSYFSSPDWARF